MPFFIAILLTVLLEIGSTLTIPQKSVDVKKALIDTPPAISCLSDAVASYGIDPGGTRVPKILSGIKKPTRQNITRGYEIPLCQNAGSCDGPETSDYILVATHVKADRVVYPNNFVQDLDVSDRQLVKQTGFTDDPILTGRYKNRFYRTFCGDWCNTCDPQDVVCTDSQCLTGECKTDKPPVTLQFQGTYHCDFIFYLEDSDDRGNPQLDGDGNFPPERQNDKLPELPANDSFFSIYFRKGATIPDSLKCPFGQQEDVSSIDLESAGQKSLKLSTFLPASDWIKKWVQESKPAIYIYPKIVTPVTVRLHPQGYLTVSDPIYNVEKGWQVIAFPDGTLQQSIMRLNLIGGSTSAEKYPYLYYEAQLDQIPQISSGFVVGKQDLTVFLSGKLQELGLNDKEIGDYLEYWIPRLDQQPQNYFLVNFLNQNQIETLEPIDIDLSIDSEIRIRTYFKPLANPIDIPAQTLQKPAKRSGNVLVEWGGILDTP